MPHHVEGRILPSDIPGKENRVYRVPVGVVCLISPWDFPVYLTARTLAPALALGNAVVLKPSSQTPVTGGLLLARVLEEAGLPAGLLSVLVGAGSRGRGRPGLAPDPAGRLLHRLDRDRDRHLAEGRHQEAAARAGRQRAAGRARRRRPRLRRGVGRLRVVLQLRPDLHDRQPGHRRRLAARRLRRGVRRQDPLPDGGRPGGPGDVHRSGHQRRAAGVGAGQGAPGGGPGRPPRARRRPDRAGRADPASPGPGRHQRRRDGPGGGLRPGHHDRGRPRRGGRAPPGQPDRVRPLQRGAHRGPRAGRAVRAAGGGRA